MVKRNAFILMAEDDPDDRVFIADALQECGFSGRVKAVEDGVALMDYLRSDSLRPDIIFLDLNMPRKSGEDALKEIRANPELCDIPIVVFATSSVGKRIAHYYRLGANSFFTKPPTFQELRYKLDILLRYWFDVVKLPE